MSDVIKFVASMVQSNTGEQSAGIADIARTLDVTTVADTVKIALSIPEAQLEKMFAPAAKVRKTGVI